MKRGTIDHPKVTALCEALNIRRYEAVGILEMLWHFTAKYAPQGDIGKYADKAIAAAVDWQRPTGARGVAPECKLSDALVACGWLDRHPVHRLVVHDWHDHADQTLKRFLASKNLAFASVELAKTSLPLAGASCPLPEPEPDSPPPPKGEPAAPGVIPFPDRPAETPSLDNPPFSTLDDSASKPKRKKREPDALDRLIEPYAARIHARHPARRSCGPGEIKAHLRTIAMEQPAAQRMQVLERIDQNHAGWCDTEDWRKDNGEFAKGLANWLCPSKGRWDVEPPKARSPSAARNPFEIEYPMLPDYTEGEFRNEGSN